MKKSSIITIDNPEADNIDESLVSFDSSYSFSDLAVQVGGLKFREVKKTKREKEVEQ